MSEVEIRNWYKNHQQWSSQIWNSNVGNMSMSFPTWLPTWMPIVQLNFHMSKDNWYMYMPLGFQLRLPTQHLQPTTSSYPTMWSWPTTHTTWFFHVSVWSTCTFDVSNCGCATWHPSTCFTKTLNMIYFMSEVLFLWNEYHQKSLGEIYTTLSLY